jgi:hypothetical protein
VDAKTRKAHRRISMKLRGFNSEPLITEDLALEIAKLLLIREFGSDDFELQQPLSVKDEGDAWLVEGSREFDYDAPRADRPEGSAQMVDGNALVEISKENGAILALMRFVDLAESDGSPK